MNSRATGISFLGALILTIVVVLAISYFMTGKSAAGIVSIVKTEVKGQKDVNRSNMTQMIPPTCSGSYNGVSGVTFPECTNGCTPKPDCEKCEGSAACISDSTSSSCINIMDNCRTYRACIAQHYCLNTSGCLLDPNCKCDNGACILK